MRTVAGGVGFFAAALLVGSLSQAQPKPGGSAPDKPPAAADTGADDDATDADEKPPEESSSAAETKPAPTKEKPAKAEKETDATSLSEGEDETPPEPPLPPPRPDEQEPRPAFAGDVSHHPQRLVLVGPDFGVTARSSGRDDVTYAPGFTWGGHVRAELLPFLGFRAWFTQTKHAVDVKNGALGLSGHQIDQPDMTIGVIGATLEPTWVVTPRLRLWLGLGLGWSRLTAPIPTITPNVVVARRKGVFLEWTACLAGSFEVIPDWLAVSLSVAGGTTSNQTGDVFDSAQGIDQTGVKVTMDGYPQIESTASALLGLDVIL